MPPLPKTLAQRIGDLMERSEYNGTGCLEVRLSMRDRKGYGRLCFNGRMQFAHRLIWMYEMGDPTGFEVCHHCDNPACIKIEHLFLGTHADNMRDAAEKGRRRGGSSPGATNPAARLNNEDVTAIRAAIAGGEAQASIARRFGMSKPAVNHIATGKTWKGAT